MLDYNQPCNMKAYDVYPVELFKKAGYDVHTQIPGIHWITSKKHGSIRVYIHVKFCSDPTLARLEVQNLTTSTDYEKVKSLFDMHVYNFVPTRKPSKAIPKPMMVIVQEVTQEVTQEVENCDIIFDGTLNFD